MTRDEALADIIATASALRGLAVRALNNIDDADDVLQEATIGALQALDRGELLNPGAYLAKCLRNQIATAIGRRMEERRGVPIYAPEVAGQLRAEGNLERRVIATELVHGALAEIRDRDDRKMLLLSILEDDAPAARRGFTPGQYRNRLHRAKRALESNIRRKLRVA